MIKEYRMAETEFSSLQRSIEQHSLFVLTMFISSSTVVTIDDHYIRILKKKLRAMLVVLQRYSIFLHFFSDVIDCIYSE